MIFAIDGHSVEFPWPQLSCFKKITAANRHDFDAGAPGIDYLMIHGN